MDRPDNLGAYNNNKCLNFSLGLPCNDVDSTGRVSSHFFSPNSRDKLLCILDTCQHKTAVRMAIEASDAIPGISPSLQADKDISCPAPPLLRDTNVVNVPQRNGPLAVTAATGHGVTIHQSSVSEVEVPVPESPVAPYHAHEDCEGQREEGQGCHQDVSQDLAIDSTLVAQALENYLLFIAVQVCSWRDWINVNNSLVACIH